LRRWPATLLEAALSGTLALDKFTAVPGILVMVVAIAAVGVAVARHQPANPLAGCWLPRRQIRYMASWNPKHALAWIREGGA
jgi:hypothetical protein